MARKLILENLMKLAQGIGANPSKFMGTKTNISFLGSGPTRNPLFQRPLAGIDQASMKQLGPGVIPAIEDAMGFATAGKLNDIQLKILTENLTGINKILNPPPLPMATITKFPTRDTGIGSLGRDAKFADFFGYPRNPSGKRMSTGELIEWQKTNPKAYAEWRAAMKKQADASAKKIESRLSPEVIAERSKRTTSMLPEPGPGEVAKYQAIMSGQTGISRGIARQILLQDTRLNLPPELVQSLKLKKDLQKSVPGVSTGPDPLDVLQKYYGKSVFNFDDWLNNQRYMNFNNPTEAARAVLKEIELIPQFASGGLARVLEL